MNSLIFLESIDRVTVLSVYLLRYCYIFTADLLCIIYGVVLQWLFMSDYLRRINLQPDYTIIWPALDNRTFVTAHGRLRFSKAPEVRLIFTRK